jgi:hypothetical protein
MPVRILSTICTICHLYLITELIIVAKWTKSFAQSSSNKPHILVTSHFQLKSSNSVCLSLDTFSN